MAQKERSPTQQTQPKGGTAPPISSGAQSNVQKDAKYSTYVEEAELRQWIEFAADVANRTNLTDDQAMVYLLFLNKALSQRAFVTGPRSTIADTTLYAALRDALGKLSFYDKERIPHVGRWFTHLQSVKGQKSPGVIFSLTPLY